MKQLEKNNIFLAAWYNSLTSYILVPFSFDMKINSIFTFFADIMLSLYPNNTTFSKFLQEEKKLEKCGRSFSYGTPNHTLLENRIALHWGTYLTNISNEEKYFNSDIKCGDIFLYIYLNCLKFFVQK